MVNGTCTVVISETHRWKDGADLYIEGTINYNGYHTCTVVDSHTVQYTGSGNIAEETAGVIRGTWPLTDIVVKNNILYKYNDGVGDWTISSQTAEYNELTHNYCTDALAGLACKSYDTDGDINFVNDTMPDITLGQTTSIPNLALRPGSPAIDAGTHLTLANGSGSGSTTLVVDDALYFQDGSWGSVLAGHQPDVIAVGSISNKSGIVAVDYETQTVSLDSPLTWNDRAPVWLYSRNDGTVVLTGTAPDLGAFEALPSLREFR